MARAQTAGAADIVFNAVALVGTPYRYGGSAPADGFDCSGFVRHVFGEVAGLDLPRRSEELRRVGAVVARDQVAPGDLVFFNTLGRPWSHVGIALGEGRFVHAPARGGQVRIERLTDPYWRARYNGARRVEWAGMATEPSVVAAAEHGPAPSADERITP